MPPSLFCVVLVSHILHFSVDRRGDLLVLGRGKIKTEVENGDVLSPPPLATLFDTTLAFDVDSQSLALSLDVCSTSPSKHMVMRFCTPTQSAHMGALKRQRRRVSQAIPQLHGFSRPQNTITPQHQPTNRQASTAQMMIEGVMEQKRRCAHTECAEKRPTDKKKTRMDSIDPMQLVLRTEALAKSNQLYKHMRSCLSVEPIGGMMVLFRMCLKEAKPICSCIPVSWLRLAAKGISWLGECRTLLNSPTWGIKTKETCTTANPSRQFPVKRGRQRPSDAQETFAILCDPLLSSSRPCATLLRPSATLPVTLRVTLRDPPRSSETSFKQGLIRSIVLAFFFIHLSVQKGHSRGGMPGRWVSSCAAVLRTGAECAVVELVSTFVYIFPVPCLDSDGMSGWQLFPSCDLSFFRQLCCIDAFSVKSGVYYSVKSGLSGSRGVSVGRVNRKKSHVMSLYNHLLRKKFVETRLPS